MIDPKTGIVSFDQPAFAVPISLTREQFLASPWSKGAETVVANEPWHSWKLSGTCLSGGERFVVVLYFNGEKLDWMELADSDAAFGTSWDDFSEAKEMARKASHDRWLASSLKSQRSFGWGTVDSIYDPRSGGSSIVIRAAGPIPSDS